MAMESPEEGEESLGTKILNSAKSVAARTGDLVSRKGTVVITGEGERSGATMDTTATTGIIQDTIGDVSVVVESYGDVVSSEMMSMANGDKKSSAASTSVGTSTKTSGGNDGGNAPPKKADKPKKKSSSRPRKLPLYLSKDSTSGIDEKFIANLPSLRADIGKRQSFLFHDIDYDIYDKMSFKHNTSTYNVKRAEDLMTTIAVEGIRVPLEIVKYEGDDNFYIDEGRHRYEAVKMLRTKSLNDIKLVWEAQKKAWDEGSLLKWKEEQDKYNKKTDKEKALVKNIPVKPEKPSETPPSAENAEHHYIPCHVTFIKKGEIKSFSDVKKEILSNAESRTVLWPEKVRNVYKLRNHAGMKLFQIAEFCGYSNRRTVQSMYAVSLLDAAYSKEEAGKRFLDRMYEKLGETQFYNKCSTLRGSEKDGPDELAKAVAKAKSEIQKLYDAHQDVGDKKKEKVATYTMADIFEVLKSFKNVNIPEKRYPDIEPAIKEMLAKRKEAKKADAKKAKEAAKKSK